LTQIRNLVTVNIHLHLLLETPFRGRNVRSLAVCSEMLQVRTLSLPLPSLLLGSTLAVLDAH
jgi:hypothetical protein